MLRFFRTRKILILDIPPPSNGMRDDLAIIAIGILCAVAAIAPTTTEYESTDFILP